MEIQYRKNKENPSVQIFSPLKGGVRTSHGTHGIQFVTWLHALTLKYVASGVPTSWPMPACKITIISSNHIFPVDNNFTTLQTTWKNVCYPPVQCLFC